MATNTNFTKQETILNEMLVEEFSPSNLHANQVSVKTAGNTNYDQTGVTERRNVELMTTTSTGRDITGQDKNITALTVPVSLSDDDIINVPFTLNTSQLKDKSYLRRQAKAAVKKLSNAVDLRTAGKIANEAGIVLTHTGEFDDYETLARAETEFRQREIDTTVNRCINLNPRASRAAASVLAGRESGIDQKSAYEASKVPAVAGFSTHAANIIANIAGNATTGLTVDGADQFLIPVAYNSTTTSNPAADSRYQTLTVSSSAALAVGDSFTIAGVNSIGMVSKQDSGARQSFRVISKPSATTVQISPAIIPADATVGGSITADNLQDVLAYANVTSAPANNAAITILNTANAQVNTFFAEEAVELFTSPLMDDELSASMAVNQEATDSGISILFARSSSIDALTVKYRLSCKVSAHVLDPCRVGVMLPNQGASFGG